MEKIADIIESIAHEKKLESSHVKERVITALINTAKRIYGNEYDFYVGEDDMVLYQKITVVHDYDERLNEENHALIALSKAKETDKDIEVDDELSYELSFDNLGHMGANTFFKELEYHIQRLVEEKLFEKYQDMKEDIVFGPVVRVDDDENTFIEIGEIRAFLPMKNRIKGEKFKVGDVVKAVIRRIFLDKNKSIKMELSRTSPKFLESLLKKEVPEIKDGLVEIKASARIPGERAKIALMSLSPGVDPVGAAVGIKGVRINAVSAELNGENIDCLEYSSTPAILITKALSPAIISSVVVQSEPIIREKDEENNIKYYEKKGLVQAFLQSEQKPKAIGKSGINIRLASMLSNYEIELKELDGEEAKPNAKEAFDSLKALFKD